jgi:catechol 2,3-dioxygenase
VARQLGEVVVRVADLDRSIRFYRDVLGFPLIHVIQGSIAFIQVAEGVEGHTQIIGRFRNDWHSNREGKTWDGAEPRRSTLHHFAIEISSDCYDDVLAYPTEKGLRPNTQIHPWIGWRSIYVSDPDDHTVEFVCFDRATFDA